MHLVGAGLLERTDWTALDPVARRRWLAALRPPAPVADVAAIVARVRRDGDQALYQLTRELDGVELDGLWVSEAGIEAGAERVPKALRIALETAAAAIGRFHADQRDALRAHRRVRTAPGIETWRRWLPLERIGAYVPGGGASYPSTVLMLGVPARLAGCGELILATPPGPGGAVEPAVLFAAWLVGVRRVLRVGGAQAVAAMAYGTESVPRVDRILGPGNAWVTAAKRLVAADTPIDLPAGPSECVVVADASADAELVALDLLAQAEHGPGSVAILVTDTPLVADRVEERIETLAAPFSTGERAVAALRRCGRAVLVRDTEEAIDVVNAVAPEHVSLQCAGADDLADAVRTTGALSIGPWTAVAAGDYATGINHVLPTGGGARVRGGLGVEDFGRWMEVQRLTPVGARRVAPLVEALADAEGLPLHGASATARAARAKGVSVADDPIGLLRRPGSITPYPPELSATEIATSLGLAPERVVRFDTNTLGGGALPGAAAALAAYGPDGATEYPDMAYRRLRELIAARHGIDPGRVIPGVGADELIRLVTTAVIAEGDAVIVPIPTFAMFAVEATLLGARVIEVPRRFPAERQLAATIRQRAEAEAARLVWLCSPNNPTGDRYALGEMQELAADLPAIVVVDEVYLEFAEVEAGEGRDAGSALRLQEELPNVLALRSLAKSHGLAGARVGYLVVPPGLAARFDALRLPYPVAGPSEAMALGALADDGAVRRRQMVIVAERRRLAEALASLGCEVLPSVANFVTFRPPDAAALAGALAARGLVVRTYEDGIMAGWLRATARDRDETDRLIGGLRERLG